MLGEWFSGVGRSPCGTIKDPAPGTCREAYGDNEPPCERCFPGIHKFNESAVTIYKTCGEQYISTSGGAVGLDLTAADRTMDWYKVPVEDRPDLFGKVNHMVMVVINNCKKEADRKAKKKTQ